MSLRRSMLLFKKLLHVKSFKCLQINNSDKLYTISSNNTNNNDDIRLFVILYQPSLNILVQSFVIQVEVVDFFQVFQQQIVFYDLNRQCVNIG